MLTQCPSCQTTFRVTSEILRVAHGQVRCGRCQTQFDALERLLEENDAGEVQSGRYLRPARAPIPEEEQIEVDEPQAQEDITLEGRHIEISGTYRVADDEGRGEQIRQQVTEEWVEIAEEEPEDKPEDEDFVDEDSAIEDSGIEVQELEESPAEAIEEEEEIEEPVPAYEDEAIVDPIAAEQRAARRNAVAAQSVAHPELDLFTERPRLPVARIWKILAAPLVFLLAAQMIHNTRATLARHPRIGAPLVRLYGALGMTLQPDWNLHAYEVRQWGVTSDPATPGTLRVRASVKNLAEFAQPYPLLKLVLEDRWGNQVRAREFEPVEYLDPTSAPDRLLAPAQQANASVTIVDPGPDAEGYRFDVCLRGARGAVCAGDVPAPTR